MPQSPPIPGPGGQPAPPPDIGTPTLWGVNVDASDGRILVTPEGDSEPGRILVADMQGECCCGSEPCDRLWRKYTPCPRDEQHVDCPTRVPPTLPVYLRCDTPCPDRCGVLEGTTLPAGIRHRGENGVRWCYQRTGEDFYDPAEWPEGPPAGVPPLPAQARKVLRIDACTSGCTSSCCACHRWVCGQKCTCDQQARPTTCARGAVFYAVLDDPNTRCVTGDCTDFSNEQGYAELPSGAVEASSLGGRPCCEDCNDNDRCPDCGATEYDVSWYQQPDCDGQGTTFRRQGRCCCSEADTTVTFAHSYTRADSGPSAQVRQHTETGQLVLGPGEDSGVLVIARRIDYYAGDPLIDTYEVTLYRTGCAAISKVRWGSQVPPSPYGSVGTVVETLTGNCDQAELRVNWGSCSESIQGNAQLTQSVSMTHGVRSSACRANCGDYDQGDPGLAGGDDMSTLDILRGLAA